MLRVLSSKRILMIPVVLTASLMDPTRWSELSGAWAASSDSPKECAAQFSDIWVRKSEKNPNEFVSNNVLVTGEKRYPLSMVQQSLGVTGSYLSHLSPDAAILSVGEGISELTPYLRRRFPNTKALDIWYGEKFLPPELQNYVDKHRPHLVAGSATKIPLEDRSQDLVVSHLLINNFDKFETRQKSLKEMVRVLKSGGEARITFLANEQVNPRSLITPHIEELQSQLGDEVTITFEMVHVEWVNRVDKPAEKSRDIGRLVIRRR